MAFINYNERDLNSFLIGNQQTSSLLGPGAYQPKSDFDELKKRTKSKKPPAFMDGIPPGKETVAVGSNYRLQTYNPGPGKYKAEDTFSPFAQDIFRDKSGDTHYFMVNNGGKLTRKAQGYAADTTKKFAY